jgi:hypothetical protein
MLSSKTGQTRATEVGGWDVLYFVFANKKLKKNLIKLKRSHIRGHT